MSYIDSQIRELREIAEIYEGMDGGELLKECADTIESLYKKLTEKSNGGWIPCSERLPEETGFYMDTKKIRETGERFTGKSRFDTEKGWDDPLNFVDIVAWQPLPEAYHG